MDSISISSSRKIHRFRIIRSPCLRWQNWRRNCSKIMISAKSATSRLKSMWPILCARFAARSTNLRRCSLCCSVAISTACCASRHTWRSSLKVAKFRNLNVSTTSARWPSLKMSSSRSSQPICSPKCRGSYSHSKWPEMMICFTAPT